MARRKPELKGAIRLAAASHIGASPKRTLLEDRARAETITSRSGLTLVLGIVADGIGGENAGERAAELTVQIILEHCRGSRERNVPRMLESALREANQRVFSEAKRSQRKTNMGSTAAVAAIVDSRLYVANAGDSRVYLIRGNRAYPLTLDHTWEHEVVQSGKLSRLEAAGHPRKDDIVRSIGYQRELKVDLGLWLRGGEESYAEARAAQGLPMHRGDVVLLCSDGLIKRRHDRPAEGYVESSEFAPLVRGKAAKRAAEDLIKRALSRQTDDNVSAVVLAMPGGGIPLRRLAPALGVGAAALTMMAAAAWALPKVVGGLSAPAAAPTIPALPSGVAFVSEIAPKAEVQRAGGEFEILGNEALVAAGPGVILRTQGPSSYIRLGLADESIVYLGPDSQIELLAIGGRGSMEGTAITIERGIVMISAEGDSGPMVEVTSPSGMSARMHGSQMGASWDEITGRFDVDCFGPSCEVIFPGGISMTLESGQHLAVIQGGDVIGPDAITVQRYAFGGYAGGLVDAPAAASGASLAGGAATATRTPLGPLFVSPTPRPLPTATEKPKKDREKPPPEDTPVPPTDTSVPPSDTPVPPSDTPEPPTEPPEPTDTEAPPEPTEEPPTEPPEPTEEPPPEE